MYVHIDKCLRCGLNHNNLEFRLLYNPADEWTHWAICTTTHQPILLKVTTKGEENEATDQSTDLVGRLSDPNE